jgi:hypothetical protein
MFNAPIPRRIALLSSAAILSAGVANAQNQEEQQASELNPEACMMLADRLAQDSSVESEVRSEVEEVISTGDVARCEVIFTTWETEGAITADSLQLVASEAASERLIVQQEVEVEADAAVYQPPAEVDVDAGAPEIVWSMPRQSITVEEAAPEITISQRQPTVSVEMPQPRVTVMIPEPEVTVTWPDSTADVASLEPVIEVRVPEPVVSVNMPEPIVEVTIGGDVPEDLVQLDDGRFAPQGTTTADLEPRISVRQQEATISPQQEAETPEVVFNRGEPVINLQREEPAVTVEVVGEPEIQVLVGQADGVADPVETE